VQAAGLIQEKAARHANAHSEVLQVRRRTVIAIAVLGGLVVAGGAMIPLVSRAREIAEGHMRLQMLRDIGGTMRLYAETRTHGEIGWRSVAEQVRAEHPRFLSSFELADGTLVTYEVIGPNETNREVDPSKWVVIRDVVHEEGRPSAALFADGHVGFE
jgi:prepilin-type processing-associated H-X9-DG protein